MVRSITFGLICLAGCADLGGYVGDWRGAPVGDPQLLSGLAAEAQVALHVEAADRVSMRGTITVAGELVALRPLTRAANDTLGAMELPDQPLRSYLMVAPLAAGDALAVISLYGDERIDVRLIRSDALYAVCHLKR